MVYHPVVQNIRDLIDEHHFWRETFEHEPVRTSQQAALTRPGYTLRQGAKAMIVKIYRAKTDSNFVMLVFPADKKFNSKKVQSALGIKNLRFATEQEVSEITNGVQVGGVPPFGNLFGLDVYADPSIFQNEKMVFNAGDRGFSLAMKTDDYRAIVKPQITGLI